MTSVSSIRSSYDRLCGCRDNLSKRKTQVSQEIHTLEDTEYILDLVANLIRSMIDNEVTEGVESLETLQTEALRAVFPDQNNSVRAEVEIKRGKVNVTLVTYREYPDGTVVEGPATEAFGGALTTVQSVLLRITVMLRRGLRPFMVLDESLPAISQDYVIRMAKFLSLICDRLGMDILIVTHDPLLVEEADRAYKIHQRDGVATFKRLR